MTQTPPAAEKWRRNEAEITSILPLVEELDARLDALRVAADAEG